jgi:hypothetical protein
MNERTCIICRSKGDKRSLVRIVYRNGALEVEERTSLPGRGAYVHPSIDCVSKMGNSARWEKALGLQVGSLDREQLRKIVEGLLTRLGSKPLGGDATAKRPGAGRVRL